MSELITIKQGTMEATVDSAGAQLMSLKKDGGEYLWQRDPKWWPRCAPVLFPIVGNIRDDRADSAQGEIRFGRHGLARTCEFVVADKTETSMTLSLSSTEETKKAFPYDFRLDMTYALADDALEQRFTVTNTGDVTLPFVVGGHPAFNVPAPGCDDENFGDYVLKFAEAWTYASPTISTATGLIDFQTRFSLVEDSDTLPLSHRLASQKAIHLSDLAGEKILIHNKIGFWYGICKEKIPNATFLEQSELSALREIVSATDLVSFMTDVSGQKMPPPKGKVIVPILDEEVNVQFYCVCKKERAQDFTALFSAWC